MSQSLPIILVASLLAGGAGALATTAFAPRAQTEAADDATVSRADADVLSELRILSEQNRELSERLSAIEVSSELAPVGGPGRTAASAAPDDLRSAIREVMAAMGEEGEPVVASPNLAKAVESVLDMREERERLEREQQRAEQAAKRLEDRLAKLQTDLGLDQSQVNSMREIFQNEDVRRETMRAEMRTMREAGGSWEDMRGMMTAAREEQKVAIQAVLTPSQYETYEATQQDDRGFGRGGRGGGGGGNGGGGRRGN